MIALKMPSRVSAPHGPRLRDIHMPPAPSWWPPAPGWWMLAGLCLLGLGLLAWLWLRRQRRVRRWQVARRELDAAAACYAQEHDGAALAASVSQLLRRAGRLHDREAAAADGARWNALLHALAPDRACADTLLDLQTRMYLPDAQVDGDMALTAARRWLRRALLRRPGHV